MVLGARGQQRVRRELQVQGATLERNVHEDAGNYFPAPGFDPGCEIMPGHVARTVDGVFDGLGHLIAIATGRQDVVEWYRVRPFDEYVILHG